MFHRGEQKPKGRTGVGDLHTNWHITPELEGLHPSMKIIYRGISRNSRNKNWGSRISSKYTDGIRGNLSPSEYSRKFENNVFLGKNR
ncbi:hypothetical protein Bca4012_089402 [Brassica carinata]